jgi:predicted DNA-binding transcriptional regulator
MEQQNTTALRTLLGKIGLEPKEIEIYLVLLGLKVAKVTDIAVRAKEARPYTYLILRALKKKGLVSEIERGKVIHFVAEPPQRLLGYVDEKQEELKSTRSLLEGAMPLLASITQPLVGKPRVTLLQGMDGMKQVYRDAFSQEFVGIFNAETLQKTFGGSVASVFGSKVKLQGRDLLVDNAGAKKHAKEWEGIEGYEFRVLPKDVRFEIDTMVYGDTVVIFSYDDEQTIVQIENQNIANAIRAWFEVMWVASRKEK